MRVFSGEGKGRGFLLLFGSRAVGGKREDSDYDFLHVYDSEKSLDDMSLIRKYKGHASIDEMPLETFIEGIRIGVPEILIISKQAVAMFGKRSFKQVMYQNQGVTSLTISLCLEKTEKTLKVSREYLKEGFLREAAHRLAIAAFWIGTAYCFLRGEIPSSKRDTFHFLHVELGIPIRLSVKFDSYKIADLEEPCRDDVQAYFKKVTQTFRRLHKVAFKDYMEKAKKYLNKAKRHLNSGDPDSSILMSHSAVELAVKGYLIKEAGKAPLHLLEALSNPLFLSKLKKPLSEDTLNSLVELNKMRNAVYHTTYTPTSNDAENALSTATKILAKLSRSTQKP